MKTLSCRYCGRTLTKEEEGAWHQALETGTCPSCGRYYDPGLEPRVERMAQDPGVLQRARLKRAKMILTGLLCIVAVFLCHHFGVRPSALVPLIVLGAIFVVYGAVHTARKQARTEVMERTHGQQARD